MTDNVLLVPSEMIVPVDQLSDNTRRRCEAAIREWNTGRYNYILVTGGEFLPSTHQTRPASHIMREWLIERGVPDNCILVEDQSLDTYQNISMGLEVLRDKWLSSAHITVITQMQHAIRFKITFYLAHDRIVRTIWVRQPEMSWKDWIMEWLVLIPYHIFDWRGTKWLACRNRADRQASTNN